MNLKFYTKFWLKTDKKEIPTQVIDSIYEIDWKNVQKRFKVIVFDLDDTLGEHGGEISSVSLNLLSRLSKDGLRVVILSNCRTSRESILRNSLKNLKVDIISNSDKPNPDNYCKVIKKLKALPSECIVVGDRVATDLFGAFICDIPERILVKPYSEVFGGKKPGVIYRTARMIENFCSKDKE